MKVGRFSPLRGMIVNPLKRLGPLFIFLNTFSQLCFYKSPRSKKFKFNFPISMISKDEDFKAYIQS
ncbi:hypothetical protein NEOC65_002254 [Neochlamydia sp. AcF65]|nr:hypothetical protein [Neochlamydia sp. AcF65]MBS4169460.1 hypothetical protein [Neochlamydia sp. AcF95]NGY95601.1 hypothetical protein [Neochlamydia sp. AcF84]